MPPLRRPPRTRRPPLEVFGALLLAGCSLRAEELECTRAMAHLADCCDELYAYQACTPERASSGWMGDPAFFAEQSECILRQPCSALRPVCEDFYALADDTGNAGWSWDDLPVCSQ